MLFPVTLCILNYIFLIIYYAYVSNSIPESSEGKSLTNELGSKLVEISREKEEILNSSDKELLVCTIQRGNDAAVLRTVKGSRYLKEVFYIL